MRPLPSAEIFAIGDELLIGRILETNAHRLVKGLTRQGVILKQIRVLPDQPEALLQAIDSSTADLILVTGGLGPTKDDHTRSALAQWLGVQLVVNPAVHARLEAYYERRGRKLNALTEQMAYVPEGAEVLLAEVGAAPALRIDRPKGGTLFAFPGVPWEVDDLAERYLWPWIAEHMSGSQVQEELLRLVGVPESTVVRLIEDIEMTLPPEIELAYNPGMGLLDLRLVLKTSSADSEAIQLQFASTVESIEARVAPYLYARDASRLEEQMGRMLLEKNLTVATAESCTGGAVAARLVSVAGASAWVAGGFITYSNELKIKLLGVSETDLQAHGAVSEPVVRTMAEQARGRTGASIGIALSGIAGPGGGSKAKPVGTVWMALADEQGTLSSVFLFENDRQRNIERSVIAALDLLRQRLLEA